VVPLVCLSSFGIDRDVELIPIDTPEKGLSYIYSFSKSTKREKNAEADGASRSPHDKCSSTALALALIMSSIASKEQVQFSGLIPQNSQI